MLARGCNLYFSAPTACAQLTTHTDPLVPGIQAAAWSQYWKWPPNRCAFNLFPGHWPLCPKEAASQAGGPKIAVYVCPWMGLSITARPLPPDTSLWWLALIGPVGVEQGSQFWPLGLWPLKGPIVTTWKGGLCPDPGSARETFLQRSRKVCKALPCRLCVAQNSRPFPQPWPFYFLDFFFL